MIESATYMESGHIQAVIDGASMVVPDDPMNRERRMIAAWERAGNKIGAYEPVELPMTASERMLYEIASGKRSVDADLTEEDFKAELRRSADGGVSTGNPGTEVRSVDTKL